MNLSWPPRDRTARYLRIRQAPSTSWVVASGWRRTRPPGARAPHPASNGRQPPGRFTIHEQRAEVPSPTVLPAARFRNGACRLTGSLSMAEDGGHDPQGLHPHPLSRRGSPPGDFISHARKAGDLNATVLPAHRLAGEPGAPVRFTFRTLPGIRTRTSSS
jgi:hypothetical protein